MQRLCVARHARFRKMAVIVRPVCARTCRRQEEHEELPPVQERTQKHPHWRKKSVCLLMGYNGKHFFGNQANLKDLRREATVDGVLEKALMEAGCILPSNYGRSDRQRWRHSSRTDKGVSSGCTWVQMRLLVDPKTIAEDPMGRAMVDEINKFLPEEVRVFALMRVPKSFNPRLECSSREYEFLLPTRLFKDDGDDPDWLVDSRLETFRNALAVYRGFHPFHNYTKRALYRPEALASRKGSNRKDRRVKGFASDDSSGSEDEEAEEARLVLSDGESAPESSEDEEVSMDETTRELTNRQPISTEAAGLHHPSFDGSSQRKKADEGLNWYATWLDEPDPDDRVGRSHFRRVLDFEAGPREHRRGSEEFVRIRVHGRSFMLHQIRKMIGGAVAAARGHIGLEALEASLSRPARMLVPKAPPDTLLLSWAHFRPFRVPPAPEEHQEYPQPDRLEVDGAVSREVASFKEEVIFERVLAPALSSSVWDEWAESLAKFGSPTAHQQREHLVRQYRLYQERRRNRSQQREQDQGS